MFNDYAHQTVSSYVTLNLYRVQSDPNGPIVPMNGQIVKHNIVNFGS